MLNSRNERRGRTRDTLRRMLMLVEYISGFRFWFGQDRVSDWLQNEVGHRPHERTIRRDLHLLDELGVVETRFINGRYEYRFTGFANIKPNTGASLPCPPTCQKTSTAA